MNLSDTTKLITITKKIIYVICIKKYIGLRLEENIQREFSVEVQYDKKVQVSLCTKDTNQQQDASHL